MFHVEQSVELKRKLTQIPEKPGVYQFYDSYGKIIYIGKAKVLRNRVHSYFGKHHETQKTRVMVSKIADLQYTVVDNESDALLLESSLVKQHRPRYNILLKDDKTFPWIVIKNEPFPRIFYTRQVIKDGSDYFGPFTSAYIVKSIIELIRKIFPLRNCTRNLDPELIRQKKYSQPCLEFHIGNCKAPCIGLQKQEDYNENVNRIKTIIQGNLSGVRKYLKDKMSAFSAEMEFEKANEMKEKLDVLEKYVAKSVIVSPGIGEAEVFSYVDDEKEVYVNYLRVVEGAIIQSHNVQIKRQVDETQEDILATVIQDIRERLNSSVKEVIVPFLPDFLHEGMKYTVPQRGDKLKLLELSERNARTYRTERRIAEMSAGKGKGAWKVLERLREDLRMEQVPALIECFDNSNLQGTNPVAACVVFKNGKPLKSEYRMFHVKTVEGPDDYASMTEIVERRYARLLEENRPLPGLVVIDGGKGQLGAAYAALASLGLEERVFLISIAKRLEEIYRVGEDLPLMLDKRSPSLKIIQQLRDEAHRFGITFHRKVRAKKAVKLEIEEVKGIGRKTVEKVYKRYGSMKNISPDDAVELEKMLGKEKADVLLKWLGIQ
jgi:excinuclease ABC subunit C